MVGTGTTTPRRVITFIEAVGVVVPTVVVVVSASSPVPPSPLWGVSSHTLLTVLVMDVADVMRVDVAPSYASAAAVDILGAEDVGATSTSGKHRSSKGKGGRGGGGGNFRDPVTPAAS
ncbi:unnamed protein product [Closterium sp. NIES-54]